MNTSGIITLQGEGTDMLAVVFPRGTRPVDAGAGTMSYHIKGDGQIHRTTPLGEAWEHMRYTFTYRMGGRSMQVTWLCGLGYGTPKATDGIASAFFDAHNVEDESFEGWAAEYGYELDEPAERRKAQRIYNACEKMDARLDAFFGGDAEARTLWDAAVRED